MPRHATGSGTNSQGNTYTTYSDGGYRYHNTNSTGTTGNYYNDGRGNGFYSNNAGYSSYTNSSGGGWTQSNGTRTAK